MASSKIITSIHAEGRWTREVDNCFLPQEHIIGVDFGTPGSVVFRVPETMSKTKPEAYAPQQLGLGPYHHFRPDLYGMHKQKVAAVRGYLHQKDQLQMFKQVVEFLVQLEPVIRACYDQYLDHDIQTLARVLAIDCLFLVHFLEGYRVDDPKMEGFTGDIFMLENQIPLVLFREVVRLLHIDFDGDSSLLLRKFDDLCLDQSPLQLNKKSEFTDDKNQAHLLQRMLCLIVNNRSPVLESGLIRFNVEWEYQPESESEVTMVEIPSDEDTLVEMANDDDDPGLIVGSNAQTVMDFLGQQGVPGAAQAGQVVSFIEKIQWDRITGLFKDGVPQEKEPKVEELNIPSASEMTEKAGIEFMLTPGGIRDIKFDEEVKQFYLPVINLKASSEIVLRNLVAFEAVTTKPESTREFAEYVDLMCGIIDTNKDVHILRTADIIKVESSLTDEEIVRIFNGIAKTTGNNEEPQSSIELAIDAGKKQYDETFRVKATRLAASCGSASLKFFKVFFTVLFFVLLTLQAYCSVFGCSRWFGKNTAKFSILHNDW